MLGEEALELLPEGGADAGGPQSPPTEGESGDPPPETDGKGRT